MKVIERIYQYIDFKGISRADFERKNLISNGYLAKMHRRKADVGEGIMTQILENSPDLSPGWLLTGEGSMLKTQPANSAGHVVIGDFKGATSHFGDISISNGVEGDALNSKEGGAVDDLATKKNKALIAEIERLKAQVDLLMIQNKEQTSQIGVLLSKLPNKE